MTARGPEAPETALAGTAEPKRRGLIMRYLSRFDDGEVARWSFRGLLVGAIGVLALDLNDLSRQNGGLLPDFTGPATATVAPLLPPVTGDPGGGRPDPRENVTADEAALGQTMRFSLEGGGVLAASGSIDRGAARRFEAEIEARGEYVRTISLNSPGGALDDAMEMARLIRDNGFSTAVADGALCASSCPLILAGGADRKVGERAAVGVHQFYAVGDAAVAEALGAAAAMSDAQATTARISRLLAELGVDPALWLHALDTPPQSLYYLTREELLKYRLVTGPGRVAAR